MHKSLPRIEPAHPKKNLNLRGPQTSAGLHFLPPVYLHYSGVYLSLEALNEPLYGLSRETRNRHLHLIQNGTPVVLLIHQVDSEARLYRPTLYDSFMHIAAIHPFPTKAREKRRMTIENTLWIGRHHFRWNLP